MKRDFVKEEQSKFELKKKLTVIQEDFGKFKEEAAKKPKPKPPSPKKAPSPKKEPTPAVTTLAPPTPDNPGDLTSRIVTSIHTSEARKLEE